MLCMINFINIFIEMQCRFLYKNYTLYIKNSIKHKRIEFYFLYKNGMRGLLIKEAPQPDENIIFKNMSFKRHLNQFFGSHLLIFFLKFFLHHF